MRYKAQATVALAASLALALSACGSDSEGGSDGGTDGAAEPIKVGVYAPLTGVASATFKITPKAVDARLQTYEESGGKCADRGFDVIEGDDTSSAEGALKVSQKFIQQDNVDVIIHNSSFFYGASQFLVNEAPEVPVFGGGYDGAPEYNTLDNNIFGVLPPQDYTKTYSVTGDFLKAKDVKKVAMIGYVSPSSQGGLEAALRSAKAAGVEQGYINKEIPFGSTDVGPIVQGIIESGSDGLYATLNPETSFGVVGGLKQAGYDLKLIALPTGYGSDLLASEPAVQAGQGVSFSTIQVPTELDTPATKAQSEALTKYTGNASGIPSFSESISWLATDMFLFALEKAGCDADGPEMIDALRESDTWDGGELLATPRNFHSLDVEEQCTYYVTLEGDGFVPDSDASPICGTEIDAK